MSQENESPYEKRSESEPTVEERLRTAEENYEKVYVKARVYGAIADRFRQALEAIAAPGSTGVTRIAKEALEWRHSEHGGVPTSAIEELATILANVRAFADVDHGMTLVHCIKERDALRDEVKRLRRELLPSDAKEAVDDAWREGWEDGVDDAIELLQNMREGKVAPNYDEPPKTREPGESRS